MARPVSRLAAVREEIAAWLVEKIAVGGALGGGGLSAMLDWNQPISWGDYWLKIALAAGGTGLVGLAIGSLLDRRTPVQLVVGDGGLFVEDTPTDGRMFRLRRVGVVNRYPRAVEGVEVRLLSREPHQGADMGRRFMEKDTGACTFSVEHGSGPTRYVDIVARGVGSGSPEQLMWCYEVPPGYANATPARDYRVILEVTGKDVRYDNIELAVRLDDLDGLIVEEVASNRRYRSPLPTRWSAETWWHMAATLFTSGVIGTFLWLSLSR